MYRRSIHLATIGSLSFTLLNNCGAIAVEKGPEIAQWTVKNYYRERFEGIESFRSKPCTRKVMDTGLRKCLSSLLKRCPPLPFPFTSPFIVVLAGWRTPSRWRRRHVQRSEITWISRWPRRTIKRSMTHAAKRHPSHRGETCHSQLIPVTALRVSLRSPAATIGLTVWRGDNDNQTNGEMMIRRVYVKAHKERGIDYRG